MLKYLVRTDKGYYKEYLRYSTFGFCYMLDWIIPDFIYLNDLIELKKYNPIKLYEKHWFPIDNTKPNPRIKILRKIIKEMKTKRILK